MPSFVSVLQSCKVRNSTEIGHAAHTAPCEGLSYPLLDSSRHVITSTAFQLAEMSVDTCLMQQEEIHASGEARGEQPVHVLHDINQNLPEAMETAISTGMLEVCENDADDQCEEPEGGGVDWEARKVQLQQQLASFEQV